nr:putative myeloid leukemia factor [Ipomoea batatas]
MGQYPFLQKNLNTKFLSFSNMNEDELANFEETWKANADKQLPGWNEGFKSLENAAACKYMTLPPMDTNAPILTGLVAVYGMILQPGENGVDGRFHRRLTTLETLESWIAGTGQ